MPENKKPKTVRSAEDDLMDVTPPNERTGTRCTALGTGSRVLSVCSGEQQRPKAYEYPAGEDDAREPEGPGRERHQGDDEGQEGSSEDESSK